MKDTRKLLSFRCDESTYRTLQKMSEKNNMSLTMLLNQAMIMYCDALEGICADDDETDDALIDLDSTEETAEDEDI